MINITNIERFATHDGEGIRTVIFLQGCLLRCPWCANPETQVIGSHLMYDANKCRKCFKCVNACLTQAISFEANILNYEQSKCNHCYKCHDICLNNAISFIGLQMSIDEIIQEVLKDWDYYLESNGGVTISGGEPFYQFEQFLKLIKRCKKVGLNVTVETCGDFDLSNLELANPYIDKYYFDIKQLDNHIYQKVLKSDLSTVMTNMTYLIKTCPDKVVFRTPVIPGFNDSDKVLMGIIDLAQRSNVLELHFLPYHTLGKMKYEQLNKEYLIDDKMMDEKCLYKYIAIAKAKNVCLKIGG